MLKLKIINTQTDEVQSVHLLPKTKSQNEYIIGRSLSCDVVLDDSEVSRTHGKITVSSNGYYYTDLGSANGSHLNAKAVRVNQSCSLTKGDRLSMGDFELLFEALLPPSSELSIDTSLQMPLQSKSIWANEDLTVRCVRIVDETPDVKTFTFVAEPALQFDYLPGQFVTLKLDMNGAEVLRSYSISSSPTRPHTLEITVKRVAAAARDQPPGLVSNWLHDHLNVGSRIQLSGAMGKFTCAPHPDPKLLLISAGSGITPMMSMSRWLMDLASSSDVIFFHCARTPSDIIFRHELALMTARSPHFRTAVSITRPGQAGQSEQPWLGLTGRLSQPMLHAIAPDFQERTVYVCGPNGFMQEVKALLTDLKFPPQNYHEESFGAPKKAKKTAPVVPPSSPVVASNLKVVGNSVTQAAAYFSQSQKEMASDGTESILELAEQAGIKIRSSCKQGVCGTCKKRKLEGNIRYDSEPDGLDRSEQDAGLILTCVATPVDRVVIEA